jgi:hypothetical protein
MTYATNVDFSTLFREHSLDFSEDRPIFLKRNIKTAPAIPQNSYNINYLKHVCNVFLALENVKEA